MPDFTGGELASEDTFPLSSEDESGNPGTAPPGEFDHPDDVVPTVIFDPVSTSTVNPGDSIDVDVQDVPTGDVGGVLRVVILVVYIGKVEIVYDGTAFASDYSGSSTSSITDGTRFTVERGGDGWLDDFTLTVYAFDTGGNEPAAQPSEATYNVTGGVGVFDVTAPQISFTTGGGDNTIDVDEQVNVSVTDDFGVANVVIWLEYTAVDVFEMVYIEGAAGDGFTVNEVAITDGTRYECVRDGDGWLEDFTLHVEAVDTSGNIAVDTDVYLVPDGIGAAVDDNVPPEVTVISPAEGSPIAADTPLVVEVTDDVDLVSTPLYAEFPGAPSAEMVYQGTTSVGGTPTNAGFLAPYVALSTVVDVAGGIRLSIRRTGGWPGAVTLTLLPVDGGGNLA